METVVTGEGDQSSPSDGHREENLDGRVLPNLYDVKRKILVSIRSKYYNIFSPGLTVTSYTRTFRNNSRNQNQYQFG